LIAQAFVLPVYVIAPLQRFIPPGDPAVSYPHVPVPLTEAQKWLALGLAPLVAGAAANAPALLASLSAPPPSSSSSSSSFAAALRAAADLHHLALAAVEAFALESSFKKWMNLVGRPRPDFGWRVAHASPDDVREGLFSYPSGHAAEFFAVGAVLALYMAGRARVFDASAPPRRWGGHLAAAAACSAPLAVATLVALSRVAGYRHDFSDINAGCALGLVCGACAYLLNYAAPTSPRSGQARVGEWAAAAEGGGRRKARGAGAPLLGGAGGEEEEEGEELEGEGRRQEA
jgi:membrane-associated phospholipid phosphatase